MFWSRKKNEPKEASQQASQQVSQQALPDASPTQLPADAPPVPPPQAVMQAPAHEVVTPALEQHATAIEQLVDLDEINAPAEQTIAPENVVEPPPVVAKPQNVQSPVPVAIRYNQFGEIVSLLLKSPTYQRAALQDLEWLVLPPLRLGQISIAKTPFDGSDTTVAIGTVIWARVSEEIDHRLSTELDKPIRLSQSDWNSGPVLWIVATAGEARVVRALIDRVIQTSGSGSGAKVRTRTPEGAVKVLNYTLGSQA